MLPHCNSLLHDRHGDRARALFKLVAPLPAAHVAVTDMRTTDTSGQDDLFGPAASGAVSPLIDRPYADLRRGDVECANDRSTAPTATTPGTRISPKAIRTTGTRTTVTWCARSAVWSDADFSLGRLYAGYLDARRHKRNTASALAFEANLQANLCELLEEIQSDAYTPGASIVFVLDRPKHREVFAAQFRDRVVHHAWCMEIAPRFERAFIADSSACIKGRGTMYAAQRAEAKVRSITRNWSRPAYYMKCDVRSFFPSINKEDLLELLLARIPEPFWRSLTTKIVMHDPRPGVEIHGDPARLKLIPPGKSLFGRAAHLGLPIGNLPSQVTANVYMNQLDQYVKHQLRARYYARYVDDFFILHEDPEQLNAWREAIEAFLASRLGLQLNPSKTIIQPLDRGLDFAGQVIKPWRRIVRPKTMRASLARLANLDEEDVHEAANSYLGLARQASHGHGDQARIANVVRGRGFSVNHALTKAYARAA